jgi:hypothetical protein
LIEVYEKTALELTAKMIARDLSAASTGGWMVRDRQHQQEVIHKSA